MTLRPDAQHAQTYHDPKFFPALVARGVCWDYEEVCVKCGLIGTPTDFSERIFYEFTNCYGSKINDPRGFPRPWRPGPTAGSNMVPAPASSRAAIESIINRFRK